MVIKDSPQGKLLKFKLHEMFDSFAEFEAYQDLYKIMDSLVYDDPLECWKDDPRVEMIIKPEMLVLQEV